MSTHRIVAYHQAHGHGDSFVSLDSIGREAPLTHLLLAALHITDDGTLVLNDHPHDDAYHDRLWAEARTVADRGVKLMIMVGGWAPGTMCKLDGADFDTYYPLLRDFLRLRRFDGIDIDVEQDMSLDGVIRLIDALHADFGDDFIIALAPVASAMWGGANLSGFDYRELERQRKDKIDFYMVQFYSGYARADDAAAYEQVFAEGVFDRDRVLLGMIGAAEDASFIPVDGVGDTVAELCRRHPDFGGVDIWEFPQHNGAPDVAWWATLMRDAMARGRLEAPTAPPSLGLVPEPVVVERGEGALILPACTAVSGPSEWAQRIGDLLGVGTGVRFTEGDGELLRLVDDDTVASGGYHLDIDRDGIRIGASDTAGVINAAATLRQLMPAWVNAPAPLPGAELSVPHVHIEDEPAYGWRGMHLDVARHFAPIDFLYRFVDLLAMHKMNVLHLHLTEDQGWRFEVKKWPRLTQIGAVRSETRYPQWSEGDGTPHGGFYTQDQLRALVGYAKTRGITIVPEIDVPGHVRALLAAYPQFGDGTGEQGVATGFGVFDEVLHLSDETVAMVDDIFTELLDVFDSELIHIGGDECPTTQWTASGEAAKLASERGLEGPADLQRWFTDHLRDFLAKRGRRMVGWDEIVERGDVDGAVVMSWRGHEPGVEALGKGHEVVMAPNHSTYFDYYQSRSAREEHSIGGYLPWQTVAAFDPADSVPADRLPRLLGVQGQLWTEYMPNTQRIEYMMFPRAAVLAEVGWRGRAKRDDLEQRLRINEERLDACGINYRPLDGPRAWQQGGTGRYARVGQ